MSGSTPPRSPAQGGGQGDGQLLERFEESDSPVGVTVPGVVRKNGVVASAANIDKGWIGTDADDLLSDELGREVHVINDADAAGWPRRGTASPVDATAWSS